MKVAQLGSTNGSEEALAGMDVSFSEVKAETEAGFSVLTPVTSKVTLRSKETERNLNSTWSTERETRSTMVN